MLDRRCIQAVLGDLDRICGEQEQAQQAFDRAATILHRLAGNIQDEVLRADFLAAPQVRRVLER